MLKRKWADRITKGEVLQRPKKGRLLLKILKKIECTHGYGMHLGTTSLM